MEKYTIHKQIGAGAFASVSKAQNKQTSEIVAIKKMKKKFSTWDECISLNEIKSLTKLKHPNIIKLIEVIRLNDELYCVFEYAQQTIYQLYLTYKEKGQILPESLIKSLIYQTVQGLAFIHKHGFFHRDLKPENLLYEKETVKIADFGLAREIRSRPPYTEYVSTRWYRAPEIMLKSTNYNSPVDIYALGCIMAELYLLSPLFSGGSELDQLNKICSVMGTPNQNTWNEGVLLAGKMHFTFPQYLPMNLNSIISNANENAINLINDMLNWDPFKRPTAIQILQHPYFNDFNLNNIYDGAKSMDKFSSPSQSPVKNIKKTHKIVLKKENNNNFNNFNNNEEKKNDEKINLDSLERINTPSDISSKQESPTEIFCMKKKNISPEIQSNKDKNEIYEEDNNNNNNLLLNNKKNELDKNQIKIETIKKEFIINKPAFNLKNKEFNEQNYKNKEENFNEEKSPLEIPSTKSSPKKEISEMRPKTLNRSFYRNKFVNNSNNFINNEVFTREPEEIKINKDIIDKNIDLINGLGEIKKANFPKLNPINNNNESSLRKKFYNSVRNNDIVQNSNYLNSKLNENNFNNIDLIGNSQIYNKINQKLPELNYKEKKNSEFYNNIIQPNNFEKNNINKISPTKRRDINLEPINRMGSPIKEDRTLF